MAAYGRIGGLPEVPEPRAAVRPCAPPPSSTRLRRASGPGRTTGRDRGHVVEYQSRRGSLGDVVAIRLAGSRASVVRATRSHLLSA